jgi:hypothetical protein
MSERVQVTRTPAQVTDGTGNAHITVESGYVEYADSADSAAWHRAADRIFNITIPTPMWFRVSSGQEAILVVTKWVAST